MSNFEMKKVYKSVCSVKKKKKKCQKKFGKYIVHKTDKSNIRSIKQYTWWMHKIPNIDKKLFRDNQTEL